MDQKLERINHILKSQQRPISDWPKIGYEELIRYCQSSYNQLPPVFTDGSFIVYKNEGNSGIPRHWHYIGLLLSDIRGHGMKYLFDKVYVPERATSCLQKFPLPTSPDEFPSGFGIELTFRVKCNSEEEWNNDPPEWPGQLIQKLAKWVSKTDNVFGAGDHVCLDWSLNPEDDESLVRQILTTVDTQLDEVETTFGKIKFIQLVGVCQEELQAAQEWSVNGILEILKRCPETGGEYLITDMTRGQTLFDLDPENHTRVEKGISSEGSNLIAFIARHKYSSSMPKWLRNHTSETTDIDQEKDSSNVNSMDHEPIQQFPGVERGNFSTMLREDTNMYQPIDHATTNSRNPSRMSYESENALLLENSELLETRFYDNLYLLIDYECARLLPSMLSGRLGHKLAFVIKNPEGDLLTAFVPEHYIGESLVNEEHRFVRRGTYLQIYVFEELRQQMLEALKPDLCRNSEPPNLPKNYSWPEYKLHITVVNQIENSSEDE